MNEELIKGKFCVGYNRQIVTPEIGTWLGGYGNGKDRATIGKIYDDDDLFVTAVVITDENGESIVPITVDLVRMPFQLSRDIKHKISDETGIKFENIIMSATHSHSSPDALDGAESMNKFFPLLTEMTVKAVKCALEDRAPAEIFAGIREVEGLNFVRRYMKEGKFLGTNRGGGDAHETPADNHLQLLKFVREGKKDVAIINWGAHPDHSKDIGGKSGTPEFHRGCSADYIYALRKTVENNSDVQFAFFEAAAGNLNARSLIEGEHARVEARAEKEGVQRFIAYGETLADEVLALLDSPLTKLNGGNAEGTETFIDVSRPDGAEIGSPEYNKAEAVAAVIYKRPLKNPTPESKEAANLLIETYEFSGIEDVYKAANDKDHPLYVEACCIKVLNDGGQTEITNERARECAMKLSRHFKFSSGPYGSSGFLRRAENANLPPFKMPLYALSCGDIAFACAPGEIFDTNGMEVKSASPFKMTFYVEQTGGTYGYFPSKLAWSHGGYELDATGGKEGTAEQISENLIKLLNELKAR